MPLPRDELAAHLRVRAAQRAARTLLGPDVGGLPSTALRDLVEASADPTVRRHIRRADERWPATVLRFPLPESLPEWFLREKALDATRSYTLSDVVVSPRTGLVSLPDGRIVLESLGSLRRLTGWGVMLHHALLPATPLADDAPVVTLAFTGYYHWLLETVPAALAAHEDAPEARFLLPAEVPPVVEQLLRRVLGRSASAGVTRTPHPRVRVPAAAFVAMTPYAGYVRPEALELLRARLDPPPGGQRAIYISRRLAGNRPLAGEEQLEERLRPHGVEIVHLERLGLDEQISLLAGAELVIAPHGAGLANLVWREAPCRVVEVFAPGHHNDCYARLCAQLGFDYTRVVARPTQGAAGEVPVEDVLAAAGLRERPSTGPSA